MYTHTRRKERHGRLYFMFVERAAAPPPPPFAGLPGLPELLLGLQGGHLGAGVVAATITAAAKEGAVITPAAIVNERALRCRR